MGLIYRKLDYRNLFSLYFIFKYAKTIIIIFQTRHNNHFKNQQHYEHKSRDCVLVVSLKWYASRNSLLCMVTRILHMFELLNAWQKYRKCSHKYKNRIQLLICLLMPVSVSPYEINKNVHIVNPWPNANVAT